MANILDNRLNAILKKEVTPLLKALKFKKRRLNYSYDFDGLCWLVNIQKSQWNDQEESAFTVNCGVYIPGILSVYANNISEPTSPSLMHCACSARIGMLMPEKIDIWWTLTLGDSASVDEDIAQDIRIKVENVALPFLNKFKSSQSVADFLLYESGDKYKQVDPMAKTIRLAYSAIIYSRLNRHDEAKRILDIAIEASKDSPIEYTINHLKNLKLKILR